jgi:hypothetical protein
MSTSKRVLVPLAGLSFLVLGGLLARSPARAQDKDKGPEWKHALELRVRKAGEDDFGKDTKKYGLEVYVDDKGGHGIHLCETGAISVVSGKLFKPAEGKIKEPLWRHGLSLAARKAGEKEFSKSTKKYGLEVFTDENNGNQVYICETGAVGTVPAKFAVPTEGKIKAPAWQHAMDLKVRKAGEPDFNKDTRKYGLEVFLDENNGNFVYITETGSFAVVPGKLAEKGSGEKKGPTWKHGMELAVRKAGEKEFTKDTKRYGIEVFLDENNGNYVYVCETGAVAVVPAKVAKPTEGKPKGPEWKHAMELAARKAGEAEFSKSTKKYGVEVYTDENNGNTIYITETGDLSVVPGKEP